MLYQIRNTSVMEDFLGKYYPGIKRSMHKKRILALAEILEKEKQSFKKQYHVEFNS